MTYPNLNAELARNNLGMKDLAAALGVTVSTASKIKRGERKLVITEAQKLRDVLFPGLKLDYLFDPCENQTSA